jgi:hypothetical protein
VIGDDDALQTNAADPDQVAHGREKTKRREQDDTALVREQLSSKQGREFVWKVLRMTGLYAHIGGDVEAVYTAIGRRSLGIELLGEVNRHPELYLQMQNEAIARAKRERDENRAGRTRRRAEQLDEAA